MSKNNKLENKKLILNKIDPAIFMTTQYLKDLFDQKLGISSFEIIKSFSEDIILGRELFWNQAVSNNDEIKYNKKNYQLQEAIRYFMQKNYQCSTIAKILGIPKNSIEDFYNANYHLKNNKYIDAVEKEIITLEKYMDFYHEEKEKFLNNPFVKIVEKNKEILKEKLSVFEEEFHFTNSKIKIKKSNIFYSQKSLDILKIKEAVSPEVFDDILNHLGVEKVKVPKIYFTISYENSKKEK